MKTLSKISGAAALIACLSLAAAANAAPKPDAPFPPPQEQGAEGAPHHPMPRPPMMLPPLYQASLQTQDPVQALNKLLTNVPKGEGKTYEVSISVRELPPQPQPPQEKADK